MKKLFLIVAAMFVAVSFSACSDDKDEASIVGEWQLTHSVGYVIEAGEQYDFDKTFPDDGYYTGYISMKMARERIMQHIPIPPLPKNQPLLPTLFRERR